QSGWWRRFVAVNARGHINPWALARRAPGQGDERAAVDLTKWFHPKTARGSRCDAALHVGRGLHGGRGFDSRHTLLLADRSICLKPRFDHVTGPRPFRPESNGIFSH